MVVDDKRRSEILAALLQGRYVLRASLDVRGVQELEVHDRQSKSTTQQFVDLTRYSSYTGDVVADKLERMLCL